MVTNLVECGGSLWFDPARGYCRGQAQQVGDCPVDPQCPSTPSPTESPVTPPLTKRPTRRPTTYAPQKSPTTEKPTNTIIETPGRPTPNFPAPVSPAPVTPPSPPPSPRPSSPPTNRPTTEIPTIGGTAMEHLEIKRELIEQRVLVSYNGASGFGYPSKQYTFGGLMQGLRLMSVNGFDADFKFLLWEGDREKYIYGLVNLAAFLANVMVESIEYDTCDELNWQKVDGNYPISNSCGQEGRSYEDENCALGSTEFLSCDVDKYMEVTAVSKGTQVRAPPPLKCKPGSFTGFWDASLGFERTDVPQGNVAGRTDIQGCCWWGRGALSTRGICNIGKINYYLGKRGADLGRSTLYPSIDFCEHPESICTSVHGELRWTTAFFEWSERVQRYKKLSTLSSDGWNFEDQLAKFVDDGMVDSGDDNSFFNSLSRILSRGCHVSGCSEYGEVRMLGRRRANFFMIVNDVLDLKSLHEIIKSSPKPTRRNTQQPTRRPTPPAGSPVEWHQQSPILQPPTEIQQPYSIPGARPIGGPDSFGSGESPQNQPQQSSSYAGTSPAEPSQTLIGGGPSNNFGPTQTTPTQTFNGGGPSNNFGPTQTTPSQTFNGGGPSNNFGTDQSAPTQTYNGGGPSNNFGPTQTFNGGSSNNFGPTPSAPSQTFNGGGPSNNVGPNQSAPAQIFNGGNFNPNFGPNPAAPSQTYNGGSSNNFGLTPSAPSQTFNGGGSPTNFGPNPAAPTQTYNSGSSPNNLGPDQLSPTQTYNGGGYPNNLGPDQSSPTQTYNGGGYSNNVGPDQSPTTQKYNGGDTNQSPVPRPKRPRPSDGNDGANEDLLIGLEGNFASRISANLLFHLNLFAAMYLVAV